MLGNEAIQSLITLWKSTSGAKQGKCEVFIQMIYYRQSHTSVGENHVTRSVPLAIVNDALLLNYVEIYTTQT